jgi:branched-chain amino acid transport system substrate-binding protein
VSYNGPGRDAEHDLAGPEVRVGLLAPLAGTRHAEGEALCRATEMGVEEANAASLPGGRHLTIVKRDESGSWGRASSEIVHLVFDDQALAVITSTDGDVAHLAEQVANKIGVPILTLSSDSTTTEINLPWIFRVGPDDSLQAQAFARDIYQARQWQRVALLYQDDHDGRLGGEEFAKAVHELNAPSPIQIAIEEFGKSAEDALPPLMRGLQAVVIWADAATAHGLIARLRKLAPSAPFYLCSKAAQGDWNTSGSDETTTAQRAIPSGGGPGIWTIVSHRSSPAADQDFARNYRQRFGSDPSVAAAEAYDAVRVLVAALRYSGPNRARLRDALASVSGFQGVSGIISFDHAGNDTSKVALLRIQ